MQGRHFFVTLPDAVCPESIGRLSLFTYVQARDSNGNVAQRVAPMVRPQHDLCHQGELALPCLCFFVMLPSNLIYPDEFGPIRLRTL